MSRMSWKRSTSDRRAAPETYELRCGGVKLAIAQRDEKTGLWFWYGDGRNTANCMRHFNEVRAEAMAHFREKAKA